MVNLVPLKSLAKCHYGCTHHLSGGARHCHALPQGASHPCRQGRCGGSPYKCRFFWRETRGWCGGAPLYPKTLFQALYLPVLCLIWCPQEEQRQGKGVVTGCPGGAPPPSLPRSAGEGPSRPPRSPERCCMTNHACTHHYTMPANQGQPKKALRKHPSDWTSGGFAV
jgi:hypothetical protein